jgi:RNA polymerase sigma-70 factor (ECF subfamily)
MAPDAILDKAMAGDEAALSELLRQAAPELRASLAGKIGKHWQSMLEPDDVLQVTFLEAFLRIRDFKPTGPGSHIAWLRRIAENNLRDAIRGLEADKRPSPRKRLHSPTAEQSFVALVEVLGVNTTTPSRDAAKGEAVGAMMHALRALPADYQKVIRLYDLEGLAAQEVATELGRSLGAMFMLRARAHDRLKDELGSASQFFSIGS